MLRPYQSSLVVNPDSFYRLEGSPLFRDHQISEVRSCFLSKSTGVKLNAWVFGPPGSGKSLSVRHLLKEATKGTGILQIYVNCRKRFTFLSVIERILDKVQPIRSPKRMRGNQSEILIKALSDQNSVIALDEIDVLKVKDSTDLLHHLCSFPKVSVICIAPSISSFDRLPNRVKSRLAPRKIPFPKYSYKEILKILEASAERCLRKNSWDECVLRMIARESNGDARRAIALLKHAVSRAKGNGSKTLSKVHIEPDKIMNLRERTAEQLDLLSSHHRLLYDLTHSSNAIHATKLEKKYREACSKSGIQSVSPRTVNKYLNSLCRRKILEREHGAGTPGWIYHTAASNRHQNLFKES